MSGESEVYHERQRKMLCALHVLNNLFQEKDAFTEAQLDEICTRLTPSRFMNPHRNMLGLGNYDINVVTAALQTRDLAIVWFDRRKNVACIDLQNVKGVIVNVPSDIRLGFVKLPFNFKHWYVIREIGGLYFNLDSKLSSPQELGDGAAVHSFLEERLKVEDTQILLVVEPEVEQSGAWYKEESGAT